MSNATQVLDIINGISNKAKIEDRKEGEPDRLDGGMRGDLLFVVGGLRWAWAEAWELSGGEHERGVIHRPLTAEQQAKRLADPDYEPGAEDDCGQGNYLAQSALRLAGPSLTRCDAHLGVACIAASGEGDMLPVHPHLDGSATLLVLINATRVIQWRLDYLVDRADQFDKTTATMVLQPLKRADTKLRAIRRALELPQARQDRNNPTAIAPDRLCKICGVLPRLRDRSRCNTCHEYKKRTGVERPGDADAA